MNRADVVNCLIMYTNAARNSVIASLENDCFTYAEKEQLDKVANYLDGCVITLSFLKTDVEDSECTTPGDT